MPTNPAQGYDPKFARKDNNQLSGFSKKMWADQANNQVSSNYPVEKKSHMRGGYS